MRSRQLFTNTVLATLLTLSLVVPGAALAHGKHGHDRGLRWDGHGKACNHRSCGHYKGKHHKRKHRKGRDIVVIERPFRRQVLRPAPRHRDNGITVILRSGW